MGKSQEQPMAGQESHRLTFRIRNHDLKDPVRTVDVLATPEEIRQIVEKGYLVREKMFTGEGLERLRRALDDPEPLVRQAAQWAMTQITRMINEANE